MEKANTDDLNNIFNLSPYIFIHPIDAGSEAFDLLNFLYDLRDLPNYQAEHYRKQIKTDEEKEHLGEMIYTTKSIADNFLMVAPILLYRLIETYLKKYLLILYETNLTEKIKKEIMNGNIKSIKKLYLKSDAKIDISTLSLYYVIEELRELNNSLKHNHDFVSPKLNSKNSYWIKNELITVDKIKERVGDFDSGINSFFIDLVKKAEPFFP